jgi:hypothetical protein
VPELIRRTTARVPPVSVRGEVLLLQDQDRAVLSIIRAAVRAVLGGER